MSTPTWAFLSDPHFIQGELMPALVPSLGGAAQGSVAQPVIKDDDPTKIVAQYTLQHNTTLFAKLYSGDQEHEDGAHTYRVMRTLWEDGFGGSARYQVAEPLAYLEDRRVLVMRGVDGVTVETHLGTNSAAQFAGVRECARWLARLHNAPVQLGRPWNIWRNFHRMGERIGKAAAERPEHADLLLRMFDRITALAANAETPTRLVQTHGQFRDLHVFVTDDVVSAIDLDRSLPADPGKDLDEFLHRLRWKTFKHTRTYADDLSAAFLGEYVAHTSPEHVANLPFFWAYHALYSLSRFVRSKHSSDRNWNDVTAFFTREFELAMSGDLPWKGQQAYGTD